MDLKQAYCYLYPSCNQYPDTYLLKPIYTQNPTNTTNQDENQKKITSLQKKRRINVKVLF